MDPLDTDSAIVQTIKSALPYLRTVEQHGPEFSEDELRQYLVVTPFCLVIANDEEPVFHGQGGEAIVTREPHTLFVGAKTFLGVEGSIAGVKKIVGDLKNIFNGKTIEYDGTTIGPFKYEGLRYEWSRVGLVTLTMNFVLYTI